MDPLVSIIIPHYGDPALTHACLSAITRTTPEPHEIIVVDNGTGEPFAEPVQVIRNARNRGFAAGCNQGAAAAAGEILLFLNNDTEPQAAWLGAIMSAFTDDDIGAVGAYLCTPDGAPGFTPHLYLNEYGDLSTRARPFDRSSGAVSLLHGACFAVRRVAFENVGGFDERFWNGHEDIDLFLALRERGWLLWHEREAIVVHAWEPGRPERYRRAGANTRLLNRKWAGRTDVDERRPLAPAHLRLRHRIAVTLRRVHDRVRWRAIWK